MRCTVERILSQACEMLEASIKDGSLIKFSLRHNRKYVYFNNRENFN